MCLLIVKPAGVKVARGMLARATRQHPDGWGMAWFDGTKVRAVKDARVSVDAQKRELDRIIDHPAIVHWRYATHGTVSFDNAHPFSIPGGFAAHNGIIPGYGDKVRSDTAHFVADVLSAYVGPESIEGDRATLEKMIGGSRVATIHNDGTVVRLGKGWVKGRSGILASNRSGFRPAYSRLAYDAIAWERGGCEACGAPATTTRRVGGRWPMPVCSQCAADFDLYG